MIGLKSGLSPDLIWLIFVDCMFLEVDEGLWLLKRIFKIDEDLFISSLGRFFSLLDKTNSRSRNCSESSFRRVLSLAVKRSRNVISSSSISVKQEAKNRRPVLLLASLFYPTHAVYC